MANDYYEFFCPVKIIAGLKALEHIPFELSSHGATRPLIISDQGVCKAGLVDIVVQAIAAAGVAVVDIFSDVPVDSSLTTVAKIAQLYREKQCDALIAIGGGSVIDTAKGSNILVSLGGDDLKAYSGISVIKQSLKPFFMVPTTAGTGSEVTLVSVIRDDSSGVKLPFVSQFLLPDAAILDPRMTLSLPPQITAATGMDALTHAIEAYTCLAKTPISDAYATAAIAKIAKNLPLVLKSPQDVHARLELAQASTMAGIAFSNSMVGLVHALGHSVGAHCHVPHGLCMSILLPHALAFNLPVNGEIIAELLLPLAGADVYASTPCAERPQKTIDTLIAMKEALYDLCQLPRSLSETGKVQRNDLSEIARMALDDGAMMLNPIDANHEQALVILEQAF